jgi:hypothetical protein
MNPTLQKKLNAYAATAGAIAATGALNAQIVYMDINPDTIVHDSTVFDLDFDNNGQPELRFETVNYMGTYAPVHMANVTVSGDTNNAIIGSLYSSQYPLPFAMNAGDSISGTNTNWRNANMNGGLQYMAIEYGPYTFGNWLGANDKYLGVRFMIGNDTHYGWVRLSVTSDADSIIIKDFAYQAQPGVGLTADQSTGIAPQQSSTDRVYSFNNVLHVNRQNAQPATVTVYNVLGEAVITEQTTDVNYTTSLENLTTGIYMVSVKTEEGESVTKVYVR